MWKQKAVFLLLVGLFISAVRTENLQQATAEDSYAVPFTKINKGVYLNRINNVLVYEGSIPVSFIMHLPSLKLPTVNEKECDASGFLCDLVNSTNSMSKVLFKEIVKVHPFMDSNKRNQSDRQRRGLIDVVGDLDQLLFGIATTKDVNRLQVTDSFIVDQQNKLLGAVAQEHKSLLSFYNSSNAYSAGLKQVLEEDMKKITKKLSDNYNTNLRDEATVGFILSNLMYNQYIAFTSSILESVYSDCRNQLIPRSLLTEKQIKEKVAYISNQIDSHGYEVAADGSSLYKLEITDCLFTKEKVQVTIHVPIRRKGDVYKFFEVLQVPYQFKTDQCHLYGSTKYIVTRGNSVVPITENIRPHCNPRSKRMCYIPPANAHPSSFSACAESIVKGESDRINKECVFQCHPSQEVRVSELCSGKVAVTNAKTIHFFCDDSNSDKKYNVLNTVGAVILKIPCRCHAIVNQGLTRGDVFIRPPYPCPSDSSNVEGTVTHIIPSHMSKIRGLLLDNSALTYTNASEVIDFDWINNIPILNITRPLPFHLSPLYKTLQLESEYTESKGLIYAWLLVLTIVLLILLAILIIPKLGSTSSKWTPVSTFMLMMPLVCGADDNKTVGQSAVSAFWELLKALEVTNLILTLVQGLFGLVFIVIIWKTFKLVSSTHRLTRQLMTNV